MDATDESLVRRFESGAPRRTRCRVTVGCTDGINAERTTALQRPARRPPIVVHRHQRTGRCTQLRHRDRAGLRAGRRQWTGRPSCGSRRSSRSGSSTACRSTPIMVVDMSASCRIRSGIPELRPNSPARTPEVARLRAGPAGRHRVPRAEYSKILEPIIGAGYTTRGQAATSPWPSGCTGGKHRSVVMAAEFAGRPAQSTRTSRMPPRSSIGTSDVSDRVVSRSSALGGGHGLARDAARRSVQLVTDRHHGRRHRRRRRRLVSGRIRRRAGPVATGGSADGAQRRCAGIEPREWRMQWRDADAAPFRRRGTPWPVTPVGNLLHGLGLMELLRRPGCWPWTRRGGLVGARGRVLPMAAEPLRIEASVRGADEARPDEVSDVVGQVEVATTRGRVLGVRLHPDPPAACLPALEAVRAADWVILGPGSWFSSVMPHLLVPDLRDALVHTKARRMLTLNMLRHDGETRGFSAADHLEVLAAHAPDLHLDVVLADASVEGEEARVLAQVAGSMGARVVRAPVAHRRSAGHPRSAPTGRRIPRRAGLTCTDARTPRATTPPSGNRCENAVHACDDCRRQG